MPGPGTSYYDHWPWFSPEAFAFAPYLGGESGWDGVASGCSISTETAAPAPPAVETWVSPDPADDTDDRPFGVTGTSYYRFTIPVARFDGLTSKLLFQNHSSEGTTFHFNPQNAHIVCRVYLDAPVDVVIPAGAIAIAVGSIGSNDGTKMASLDAITGGAWQLLRFPIPDADNNSFHLVDMGTWDASGSGLTDVVLNVDNGRQSTATVTQDPVVTPAEPTIFGGACVEDGSVVSQDALDSDFGIGILVDLTRQRVYLGSECPFTCAGVSPATSCTSQVQLPGPNFFGDKLGYVNMMFDEKILTWGSPSNAFVFAVISGTSNTVVIDNTDFNLPVDMDATGLVAGLIVAKVSVGRSVPEYRRVSGNTTSAITVSSNWSVNPVASDVIVVAPLPWMIQWSAQRFNRGGSLQRLLASFAKGIVLTQAGASPTFEPRVRLEIVGAQAADTQLSGAAADTDDSFGSGEFSKAAHGLRPTPHARKVLSYRLTMLQGWDGPAKLREVVAEERLW